MVFNQLDTELDGVINKFGILKTSYADIINAFKSDGLRGALNSVWAGNGITKSDVENIKKYNTLIDEGINSQSAFYRTMLSSSKGAQELVASCNGFAVSQKKIDEATKNSTSSLIANKAAMISMKAATIALNAALSMGLSWVISKVCEGLDYLIHLSEKLYEEAKEDAAESKENADALREEYDQVTELIKKYKELAKSDTQDSSTREEIANIQQEITDLVGDQASNLDLVNGKLDEQLDKLYEIQNVGNGSTVNRMIDANRVAFSDAKKEAEKVDLNNANWLGDLTYGNLLDTITIDYWGGNKERNKYLSIINDAWRDKGYGSAFVGESVFDTYSVLSFTEGLSFAQKADALDAAIDALSHSDGFDSDNQLYKELVSIRESLDGTDGVYTKLSDAANNLSESLVIEEVGTGRDVETIGGFNSYKEQLLNTILTDDDITKAVDWGVLSSEDIYSYIDNYLRTFDKYAEFYKAPEQSDILRQNFKTNIERMYGGGDYAKGLLNDFDEWFDSLLDDEKKIVCNLSLDTSTANYQLSDWQNALANYEIPEEDRISFSELIADTDADNEFIDQVNDYRDKIASLDKAYESLDDEDYDPTDLFIQFPELAAHADDLGTAILQLKSDLTGGEDELGNFTGIYKVFQSQFGKLKTEEDATALNNLMDAVTGVKNAIQSGGFVDSISNIQKLSDGFDQLQDIYADIKDQGEFD